MTDSRAISLLIAALLLSACGSKPVHQPDVVVNARNAMALGMQAHQDDRYAEARNFFGRALMQYRSVDDRAGQLDALIDLADSALEQGEFAAARAYLSDSDAILASGNFANFKPHITLLKSTADMQAGDDTAAATKLDGLLNDTTVPADVRQAALFARTQVAFNLKSTDSAQWLGKLGASLGEHTDALSNARYMRLEALAVRGSGDIRNAAALYQNALDNYRTIYYRPGIAAALEEWADLSMQQQDWAGARDRLQRALNVRLSIYDRTHSVRDLENLSRADTVLGDTAAAKQAAQLEDYLKNGGDPARQESGE